ncbi:MAG: hypothetical protein QW596_02340 [Sulfolobales archaeon]
MPDLKESTALLGRFQGSQSNQLRKWISEGRVKAVNVYSRWRIPENEVKRLLGQLVREFMNHLGKKNLWQEVLSEILTLPDHYRVVLT